MEYPGFLKIIPVYLLVSSLLLLFFLYNVHLSLYFLKICNFFLKCSRKGVCGKKPILGCVELIVGDKVEYYLWATDAI